MKILSNKKNEQLLLQSFPQIFDDSKRVLLNSHSSFVTYEYILSEAMPIMRIAECIETDEKMLCVYQHAQDAKSKAGYSFCYISLPIGQRLMIISFMSDSKYECKSIVVRYFHSIDEFEASITVDMFDLDSKEGLFIKRLSDVQICKLFI